MTTGKEPKKYLLVSIFEVPNFDTMLPVSQLLSLVSIPCNLMPISIPKAMTNALNSGHVTYPAVMQRCNQQSLYCIVVALHGRSCLTWYIYILMLYVISYIYIYVWRTHARSTSADRLVTFVQVPFSAHVCFGPGHVLFWSLRANMLFRALEPFWSQRSALVSEVHGFRSRFANYPKLESYPRVSIARKTWKPGVSQETRLQITSNCHIYVSLPYVHSRSHGSSGFFLSLMVRSWWLLGS